MKRSLSLLVLALAAILPAGCGAIGEVTGAVRGEGPMIEETREVSGFSGIHLAGVGNVMVEMGEEEGMRIEAQESVMPYLETAVEDGTLLIRIREDVNLLPTQGIFYYVTARRLDELRLSGLGEINAAQVEGDRVALTVSGGGNINVDALRAQTLEVLLSGLGDLNVAGGAVEEQAVRVTGGGSYDAGGLASERATVAISGLGSATVDAEETLEATITGGGNVRYYGRPQVTQSVSGLGEVVPLGE